MNPVARILLAVTLGCIAVFGLPDSPRVAPKTAPCVAPSKDMQDLVAPVAAALKSAPMGDRLVWADVWTKSALVVAGDAITSEVIFTDTRALRLYTVISLDIAWRRIGGNQPGKYPGLRSAVESVLAAQLGKDEVPVTKEMRDAYCGLAKAIAWAGCAGE